MFPWLIPSLTRIKGRRMATYLFIDGAYLRARLKSISKCFTIDLEIDYNAFRSHVVPGQSAQKAFYYDCLPARGPNEKRDDYDKRVEPEQNIFKAIKSLPGYHVFLGEAVHSGGGIVQKGVDIHIAVDMLTHAFRGVIDRAILFAGDRDFAPLVSALVQQGVYVTVGYHPKSVAEELLDVADERIECDTCKLWSLTTPRFRARLPAPSIGETSRDGLSVGDFLSLRTGTLGTEEVKLYTGSNICQLYLPRVDDYGNHRYEYIYHPDETVIMKLLDERRIVIKWN
jgi:uncharacterized LabA/DUF88 family protein